MTNIPQHAKRVFKGILFDVYHWNQMMFDGSVETFEAIKRIPSTEIILTEGDSIIIAEQEQPGRSPYLSLFGGQMHDHEPTDPLEHAKKELLEETGYVSDDWELLEINGTQWSKIEWNNHLFIARNGRKIKEPNLDSGEKITPRRVYYDEFIELAKTQIHWSPLTGLFNKEINFEIEKTFKSKLFK